MKSPMVEVIVRYRKPGDLTEHTVSLTTVEGVISEDYVTGWLDGVARGVERHGFAVLSVETAEIPHKEA